MVFFLLVLFHIICSIISIRLMITIHKYLKKKPLGLQTVLDLLILDMIKVSLFNRTFFNICFILPGSLYGQFDFLTSQIIIFILINTRVILCTLFQNYLVIKSILIFKPYWLMEILDYKVVWSSRIFAFIVAFLRFYGDLLITEKSPGLMTKLLTGESRITYLKTGPFNGLLILSITITSILLKISTSYTSNFKQYELMIFRSIVTISVTIGISRIVSKEDAIDTFLFYGLVISMVQLICFYYFIKTTPNLYQFAIQNSNGNFDYKFVKFVLSIIQFCEEIFINMVKFLLCLGLNYPKLPRNNKILPV